MGRIVADRNHPSRRGFGGVESNPGRGLLPVAVVVAVLLAVVVLPNWLLGINGFGPVEEIDAVVVSKHIDASGKTSHYVVVTDAGSFEVDNGFLLLRGDADQVYGSIQPGPVRLTVKGNRLQSWFIQKFPYVLKASPRRR